MSSLASASPRAPPLSSLIGLSLISILGRRRAARPAGRPTVPGALTAGEPAVVGALAARVGDERVGEDRSRHLCGRRAAHARLLHNAPSGWGLDSGLGVHGPCVLSATLPDR